MRDIQKSTIYFETFIDHLLYCVSLCFRLSEILLKMKIIWKEIIEHIVAINKEEETSEVGLVNVFVEVSVGGFGLSKIILLV